MKAIVASGCGELEVRDVPLPIIHKDWILGKVYSFTLDGVERAIQRCKILVPQGRIVGSEGVLKVIELGTDVYHDIRGRLCIVNPLCNEMFIGIDIDGVAAEYISLPINCLELVPREYEDKESLIKLSILKTVSLGNFVAKESKDKTLLIVGSGISSYVAAYIAKKKSLDVAFMSLTTPSIMNELGIRCVGKSPETRYFDVIYVSVTDSRN